MMSQFRERHYEGFECFPILNGQNHVGGGGMQVAQQIFGTAAMRDIAAGIEVQAGQVVNLPAINIDGPIRSLDLGLFDQKTRCLESLHGELAHSATGVVKAKLVSISTQTKPVAAICAAAASNRPYLRRSAQNPRA